MATWKANVRVSSATGRNWVTVDANTPHGAKEVIYEMYGTDDIHDLHQVRGGGSSGGSFDPSWSLVGIVVLIWLCFEFAHIALPILAILFLGWVAQITQRWWDTD